MFKLSPKKYWCIVIAVFILAFSISFFYYLNKAKQDPAEALKGTSLELDQNPAMLNYTYIDINLPCLNASKIMIFNDDKNLSYRVLCWKNLTYANIPIDEVNDSLSYLHE